MPFTVASHPHVRSRVRPQNPESRIQNPESSWCNKYEVSLGPELEQKLVRPLALAAGDFDGDGIADLVSGYAGLSCGILVLHRGNVDSIFPNIPGGNGRMGEWGNGGNHLPLSHSPFLPEPRVFELPGAPDYLGTGDFDADGYLDIVAATRGGNRLYWLRGDEQGALNDAQQLELPGKITALIAGEMNRRNGFRDVIVGIDGSQGPAMLVFNSPEGAFRGSPETIALPQPAIAFSLDDVDDDSNIELAVTTGSELLIVQGQDLRTVAGERQIVSSNSEQQSTNHETRNTNHESLFIDGAPIAVLPMRLNGDALDDLVVLSEGRVAPTVLLTAPQSTFVVNSTGDGGDSNLNDQICNDGTGRCTLRAAIEQANASVGADAIHFNIPGVGVPTIHPNRTLPSVTEALTIDGMTQPAGRVEISGANAGFSVGLEILSGDSVVRGLVINRFQIDGICIRTGGNNIIEGNRIGTDSAGTVDIGNEFDGIRIEDAPRNMIGGTTALAQNLISGNNSAGILILLSEARDNVIQGNLIGTDATGRMGLGNSLDGVFISDAPHTIIGGATPNARNVISAHGHAGVFIEGQDATGTQVQGNYIGVNWIGAGALSNGAGVLIESGAAGTIIGGPSARPGAAPGNLISGNTIGVAISGNSVTGTQVQGNLFGTDATGTLPVRNISIGVLIEDASDNMVGGSASTARNVIAASSNGVQIQGHAASGNVVQGNYIGTNITGTAAIGNFIGVHVQRAPGNIIGGAMATTRNIISGNDFGVYMTGEGASGNHVQGNWIGLDVTGANALANTFIGVSIEDVPNNTIGGAAPGLGNVISGNAETGVYIAGMASTRNQVVGNLIGTDTTGLKALGNGEGVFISHAPGNTIGGTSSAARNLISGNNRAGVLIVGNVRTASGNMVRGNLIGPDLTGTRAIGNGFDGVLLSASNTTIGGTVSGSGNVISGNRRSGIRILSGAGNRIQGNLIGTDIKGASAMSNAGHGVLIRESFDNLIGGTSEGAGNIIAFNRSDGVNLASTAGPGNGILSNSIFSNASLAIDLNEDGVTPNHLGVNESGPNRLQNFPNLVTVKTSGNNISILGTLTSRPHTTFLLQFFANPVCDPSEHGEGEDFLGSAMVTTGVSGSASFSVNFPRTIPAGWMVTATATDPDNNTSEFSVCQPAK